MNATTITINFRLVSLLLLIVIGVMLMIWRPWGTLNSRTVTVSGEATVKAAPDEFTFTLQYVEEAKTSSAAIDAVSKRGNAIVARLKEIGVPEASMKTSVSTDEGYPLYGRTAGTVGALYYLNMTVGSQELAQKVLDYIVTTSPVYGVSPQSTFAKETRTKLESQARAKALADARTKGQQTAEELGGKLGRVVSVSEPQWGGPVALTAEGKVVSSDQTEPLTAPKLLVGEQDVTYMVQVVFRLR